MSDSGWRQKQLHGWLHVFGFFFAFAFFLLPCYSSLITSPVLSEPFSCRTLWAVRVPAHLPLHKTERHLFAASSPPLVSFCIPLSYQLATSHLPRIAKFTTQPTCCFCSTNARHSPLQSKLMSKDSKTWERNQQTNSESFIVCTHTHIQSLKFYGWVVLQA